MAELPVGWQKAATGAVLCQRHCAVCHRMNGVGDVEISLNLKDFLAVSSDE